ncbi:MAG TPA: hypothetical protein VHS97_00555, partial [Isosphaeraceae bacterium]|nr:hypothetical protein [Isosphaeraceae bacterium]
MARRVRNHALRPRLPDATIVKPTDAVIRVSRACICGSDLGHERTRGTTGSLEGNIMAIELQLGTVLQASPLKELGFSA